MKYFKQYKGSEEVKEITKEEAKRTLDGWWKEEALKDVFENEKPFRLYTAYAEVWTEDKNRLTPMAGFYGVAE